jgi:hypothetical protein
VSSTYIGTITRNSEAEKKIAVECQTTFGA